MTDATGETTKRRHRLVRRLAEGGVLRKPGLAEAFEAVPREVFLPGVSLDTVYADEAVVVRTDPNGIPISSSSQPSIVAVMLAQLDPEPGDRVLEMGTGTGCNAALLERLVGPDGRVVTVDLDEDITAAARQRLRDVGATRVHVRTGDDWLGSPMDAPFDRVELTVGVWALSPVWLHQLREGGVLVVPLWLGTGLQLSFGLVRRGETLVSESAQQ